MRSVLPAMLTVVAAVSAASAQGTNGSFPRGTRVVIVGQVAGPVTAGTATIARRPEHRTVEVRVGPDSRPYILLIGTAKRFTPRGGILPEQDLKDGMWIRADGTTGSSPELVRISRLQVLGESTDDYKSSAFYREGMDRGYVSAVAGAMEEYRPAVYPAAPEGPRSQTYLTLVGVLSSETLPVRLNRRLKVRSGPNEWSMYADKDGMVTDANGSRMSVHDLQKGHWVRVTGSQVDDLRIHATRIEDLGTDEVFRQSRFFRDDAPNGYLERLAVVAPGCSDMELSGTVMAVDRNDFAFILRDAEGRNHVVQAEGVRVRGPNGLIRFPALTPGQSVTVEVLGG